MAKAPKYASDASWLAGGYKPHPARGCLVWLEHGCGHGRPRTRVIAELENTKEEQLGAALLARRKEKELREQL
jgi:hypothetical protein